MTTQPGWHPDPVPASPGQPAQLRYWDGSRWTEHVTPAQDPAQTASPAAQVGGDQPAAYAGQYGSPHAAAPPTAYYGGGADTRATTPDAQPLAGWWQRVLAYVLDAILVGIVAAVLASPWISDIYTSYRDWFEEALDSSSSASSLDTAQLQSDIAGPLAIVVLIQLAVAFVYHVGFLMWRQATPGKLVLGLRVRRREEPGPMPLGTVLLRFLGQFGITVVNLVPVVGSFLGLYSLLDHLWPLWDGKKQALHDKIAKTNVVRTR